jgi:hypothetical protein
MPSAFGDIDPPLIVAILHERMDLIQRLGDRLSLV